MTTTSQVDDAARAACVAAGFEGALSVLHHHATPVYLIEDLGIVVRVDRGDDRQRAQRAVRIARWARDQGVPATDPVIDRPIQVDSMAVTFWRYYPQPSKAPTPGAAALGSILRALHRLSHAPGGDVPRYQPLIHLGTVLAGSTHLAEEDQAWLEERRQQLLQEYALLDTELGVGLIHGDAYPGNTLWDGDQVLLGDWDEVAIGPRELDLINTHQGARMGRSQAERAAFSDAYGWDVTSWAGYPTLRAMRDLHTLAAFIERGTAGDSLAASEVAHRVMTLRTGDTAARWHRAS